MTTDNQTQPTRAVIIKDIMQSHHIGTWPLQKLVDLYNEAFCLDITADEVEKLAVLL